MVSVLLRLTGLAAIVVALALELALAETSGEKGIWVPVEQGFGEHVRNHFGEGKEVVVMKGALTHIDLPIRARLSRTSQRAADGMKKLMQVPFSLATMERKWLSPLLASTMISILLLLLATLNLGYRGHHPSIGTNRMDPSRAQNVQEITEEEQMAGLPPPPKLAYLISGTKGDGFRMQRTLQALYHPHNYYLLHLDLEAPEKERMDLAVYVKHEPVFQEAGNVFVVGKANLVTYKGSTMIATTLHGAAILLRKAKDWDWFINLSASDYPLITQDGEPERDFLYDPAFL